MLFPVNAKISTMPYEKHKDYFEAIYYGENERESNTTFFVESTYEDKKITKDIGVNLDLLSESIGYQGKYKQFHSDGTKIYYAKQKYRPGKEDNITYFFFSYIKSIKTNQAVSFVYAIKCMENDKKCTIDENTQEKKAKMLMKSVEFNS